MGTIAEDLESLGITDYEVSTASLEAGCVRVRRHLRVSDAAVAAAPVLEAGEFKGWLWETVEEETGGGGRTVTHVYRDAVGLLDAVPCVFEADDLFPPGQARRGGGARLVPAGRVLAACARAAAGAGVELAYDDIPGYVMTVFAGGSGSVWGAVLEVVKWVPGARSSCSGTTVRLFVAEGGAGGASASGGVAATAWIDLAGVSSGTLSVGASSVDLAELYARYAGRYDWEANRGVLVANALVCCPEASVETEGALLRFTAREPGAAGNGIGLSFEVAATHAEEAELFTGEGGANALVRYIELDERHVPTGGLTAVSIQARSAGNPSTCSYLGLWELGEDGATWAYLGSSADAPGQSAGQAATWTFEGVELHGRKLRVLAQESPSDVFAEGPDLGARVSTEIGDDATACVRANARHAFLPQMTIRHMAEALDDAPPMRPFAGGEDAAPVESPAAAPIAYSCVLRRSRRSGLDGMPPPVVAARGRYSFEIPAGASIYQPGAFVYRIPYGDGGGDAEAAALELQERANPWSLVKGRKVPEGWTTADGEAVDMRSEAAGGGAWREFWSSFAACRILKRVSAGCLAFGAPVFEPVPVAEAFADESDEPEDGGSSAPSSAAPETAYGERDGAPANYKESWSVLDHLYVLTAGEFPAGAKAADNVRQLRFCHGSLRQYVWIKGKYSGEASKAEAQDFFCGTMRGKDGKTRRYVCLKLDSVFINRRRTRYQQGTLRLAPDDPDYDAEQDSGVTGAALREADYYAALLAYYKASRALDGLESEVELYGVSGYEPGVTPLESVFAALGRGFAAAAVAWNAASRTLTVRSGRRDILGVDDLLQRQQLGRQSAAAAALNDAMGRGSGDSGGEEGKNGYPMVAPSISISMSVGAQARMLEPFQVYYDEDEGAWMLNGGALPSPAGYIEAEPTNIDSVWQPGRVFAVRARYDSATRAYKPQIVYRDKRQ